MTATAARTQTRRAFLLSCGRGGVLAGLAALSAALLGKKRPERLAGQTCVNNSFCADCGLAGDCGLPQALSFRAVRSAAGSGGGNVQ